MPQMEKVAVGVLVADYPTSHPCSSSPTTEVIQGLNGVDGRFGVYSTSVLSIDGVFENICMFVAKLTFL